MATAHTRKRPCRICRKWFMPDPRQIGRQKTCANPACRRENHRRRCSEWNRKNTEYFKANYLSAKLDRTRDPPGAWEKKAAVNVPPSRIGLGLPKKVMADITGTECLVLQEYIIEQILRRVSKSSFRPGHKSSRIFKTHYFGNMLL